MASFNKVILIGNLTRDPELRYTPNGQAVCDFSIAVNRRYTVNGQERDEVCFIDIVAWSKQAESCGKYLKKGSPVFVEGRLRNDTWEDRDGRKRSRLRVTADRVQFMSYGSGAGRSESGYQSNGGNYSAENNYSNNYSNNNASSSGYADYSKRQNQAPSKGFEPMPEPPEDIYSNDYETEDDIPF